jgi:DNA-binding CsgD family transcriptional regulator
MLHGRESEIRAIEALIGAARRGRGGALLLHGDAGIGKTALLDVASRRATGVRQLRTAGLEAESSLPFSALAELTERLRDGISTLPAPQAAAIEGALALGPPAAADRFAVCAGFLGLLANAARDDPLLVLVDDAHWLDPASAECLGFAARRLDDKRIAVLVAARSEEPQTFRGAGRHLAVGGLERDAARDLLTEVDRELPGDVAESLIDAAAGNPLALIELPGLLSRDQRLGLAALDQPMQPGVSLQRAFERRIARLPARTHVALVVAATAFTPSLRPILAACRTLGVAPEALEPAEAEGVVRLSSARLAFGHPLLRGAVYRGARAADRRRAHRALSEYTDEDSRAWHLAAAALGPNAAVADALEATARRAAARGAHAASADALVRAARFSEDDVASTRRLLAAGLAAAMGGAYDRGVALLELADAIDDPLLGASVRHLLAMVTLNGGVRSAYDNHRTISEEAERIASIDPAAAAAMHADAGVIAAVAGNCEMILASAERAAEILPDDAPPTTRCQVLSILGMGLALRGRHAEGREALDEAGRLLGTVDPLTPAAQSISLGLGGRLCTSQETILREEAASLASAAREAGAIGVFPYYQLLVADCAYRTGDWDAAERDIAEAVEGAEESAQLGPLSIALVIAARMHAARGDAEAARSELARAMEIAEPVGYGSPVGWGTAALGFLELGLDRISEAIAELELAEQLLELAGLEDPVVVPWAPDLAEAYSRAGRADDAARVASKLAAQAARSGGPLAGALAARCEALVGDDFDQAFERALELHDRAEAPFERARTLLTYGARLHRARRRRQARERLRGALDVFRKLGAAPWVRRTEAELRAAGGIKRRSVAHPDQLTAQEVRVALAVARGATNREVAAELFLSPKTIEFHLGQTYRKLGIHSRTQLAQALRANDDATQAASTSPTGPLGASGHQGMPAGQSGANAPRSPNRATRRVRRARAR